MSGAESHTGEESPFFALEPVIIFNVIGICKKRIEGEDWERIWMPLCRYATVEARSSNFR